jgi:AcrR family transcriptional regulator
MPKRKAEQAQATRSKILKAAKELFTERGYADSPADEIVRRAGLSRGALYHHFRDKKDVFALVYEMLQREVHTRILNAISTQSDPWKRLLKGCDTYLDASLDPSVQRIVLLDAPHVFSRQNLAQLQALTGTGLIGPGLMRMFLQELMDSGVLVRQNAWSLSVLIGGALDAGALEIALAPDKSMWRRELGEAIVRLLECLRIPRGAYDRPWRQPRTKVKSKS